MSTNKEIEQLTDALRGTRAASRLALRMAADALEHEGAAGSLTIHIPRRLRDPLEVEFHLRNDHPDFP